MIKQIDFILTKASTYYSLGSVKFFDFAGKTLPIEFFEKNNNNYNTNINYFHVRDGLNTYGSVFTANVYNATSYGVDNAFDTSRVSETWHDRYNYWLSSSANTISIAFQNPVALSKTVFKPYCGDDSGRKQNQVRIKLTLFNGETVDKLFDTSACRMNENYIVDINQMLNEVGKSYDELFLMKNIRTNKYYSGEVFKNEYNFRMINNNTEASGKPIRVSSSSQYDSTHTAWRAFSKESSSSLAWVSQNNALINGQWLQVDFGEKKYVNWFRLTSRNYQQPSETLKDFDVLGSYDGINWKVAGEFRNVPSVSANYIQEFKLQYPKNYRYYRIKIIANNGLSSYVTIGQLAFGYTTIVEIETPNEINFKKYATTEIKDFNLPLGSITKPIEKELLTNNALVSVNLVERPQSIRLTKR